MWCLAGMVVLAALATHVSADGCARTASIFDQFSSEIADVYTEEARKYFFHDYQHYVDIIEKHTPEAKAAIDANKEWLTTEFPKAATQLHVAMMFQAMFGIPIVEPGTISYEHFTWAVCRAKAVPAETQAASSESSGSSQQQSLSPQSAPEPKKKSDEPNKKTDDELLIEADIAADEYQTVEAPVPVSECLAKDANLDRFFNKKPPVGQALPTPTVHGNIRFMVMQRYHLRLIREYGTKQPDQALNSIQSAISNVGMVKAIGLNFKGVNAYNTYQPADMVKKEHPEVKRQVVSGVKPGHMIVQALYNNAQGYCRKDPLDKARNERVMTQLTVKPDPDFSWCGLGGVGLLRLTGVAVHWDSLKQCPLHPREKDEKCQYMCPDSGVLEAHRDFANLKTADFLYWRCANSHMSLLINKVEEVNGDKTRIKVRTCDHYAMFSGIDIGVRYVDGNPPSADLKTQPYDASLVEYRRPCGTGSSSNAPSSNETGTSESSAPAAAATSAPADPAAS